MRHPFIFVLLTLISCSNNKFDYNSIKANANFLCTDTLIETFCKLQPICSSKNDLEIRLKVYFLPTPEFAMYVLTNDNNIWTASKYTKDFFDSKSKGTIVIKTDKVISQEKIEKLFDTLRQNKIFTLPDQDDLKINGFVDDGTSYDMTFKVHDRFRKYNFNNPDIYQEQYGKVNEFKNYQNIAQSFYNMFNKK